MKKPDAIRFVGKKPARIPFGLSRWSEDPAAAVALAAEDKDVAAIAADLPDPTSLPAGTLVALLGPSTAVGAIGRLFGKKAHLPSRAARANALLVRGYVNIGAGIDDASGLDVVWGESAT